LFDILGALDEKINTTFISVHLISGYSLYTRSLAWHKDWKKEKTAILAQNPPHSSTSKAEKLTCYLSFCLIHTNKKKKKGVNATIRKVL